jgi:hypothetical protein
METGAGTAMRPRGIADVRVAALVRGIAVSVVVAALVSVACTHAAVSTKVGPGCVDFELTDSDLACGNDYDCTIVVTGVLCPDDPCACVGTPAAANLAAGERFTIQTTALPSAECGTEGTCTEFLELFCVSGQCTVCSVAPGAPGECTDAGTAPDAPGT